MFVLLFCFSLADWRDQKYGDWVEFLGRRWAWLERSKTTIRHGGLLHWFVFDFCLGLCVCVCVCVCGGGMDHRRTETRDEDDGVESAVTNDKNPNQRIPGRKNMLTRVKRAIKRR